METRLWRMLGVSILFGFIFVFSVPIVYVARMFQCGGATMCLVNDSGLRSIGYALFGWGGTYSFGLGASSPLNGYFFPTAADPWPIDGVLLMVFLPLMVVAAALLAPEIAKISRVTRLGLVGFGGFVTILSGLAVATTTPGPFLAELIFLPMAWAGGLIVLYGTRRWIFASDGSSKGSMT
jgi:hypothetical protein